jgi:hypothetical protein
VISVRFHNTIAAVIVQLCCRLRQAVHLNQVCLSGGTFQNILPAASGARWSAWTRVRSLSALAGSAQLRWHLFGTGCHRECPYCETRVAASRIGRP